MDEHEKWWRKACEHAFWDLTGAKVMVCLEAVVIGLAALAIAWIKNAPMHVLIPVSAAAFIGALFGFHFINVYLWPKLRSKLLHEIRFDFLPASPLERGWTVAYGKAEGARWLAAEPGTGGGMKMEADPSLAIDFRLEPNATLTSRLTYAAKYSRTTMIFISIGLVSADKKNREDKWIKFEVGNGPPAPTAGYEAREWTLPISGKLISDEWREFEISLPDAVQRTWGQLGWHFQSLRAVRLRGNLSISPIKCFE